MVERFSAENINTDLVFRSPDRTVGMYLIETDDAGERRFSYWRETSAARTLLNDDTFAPLAAALCEADLIYLSGITLAILSDAARSRLLDVLNSARGQIAFDPNFRPKLWPHIDRCRTALTDIAPVCDYVLATFDDEAALWGHTNPLAAAENWSSMGSRNIVVKNGQIRLSGKPKRAAACRLWIRYISRSTQQVPGTLSMPGFWPQRLEANLLRRQLCGTENSGESHFAAGRHCSPLNIVPMNCPGVGAAERFRTSTGVTPQRPQRCASTNSATAACHWVCLAGLLASKYHRPKQALTQMPAPSVFRWMPHSSLSLSAQRPER